MAGNNLNLKASTDLIEKKLGMNEEGFFAAWGAKLMFSLISTDSSARRKYLNSSSRMNRTERIRQTIRTSRRLLLA